METELKAKWVAALRSGEFKQGRTYLYASYDNAYCCLGVLGHLCGADTDWLDGRTYLSLDMANRAGLDAINTCSMDIQAELGAMNDGKLQDDGSNKDRKTFAQIADWIEENL